MSGSLVIRTHQIDRTYQDTQMDRHLDHNMDHNSKIDRNLDQTFVPPSQKTEKRCGK